MTPTLARKAILTVHIVTSVGFLGSVAAFLALAVMGLSHDGLSSSLSGIYTGMALIIRLTVLPLAISSLLVGVILGMVSPWGLIRHYWVVIKLILTALALGVLLLQMPGVEQLAQYAEAGELAQGDHLEARISVVVHAVGGIATLLVATVLSVFKPRGLTNYGARKLSQRAPA